MPANPEVVEYIKRSAIARGIDPAIALKVAQSEALNVFDPNQPDRGGDLGSSFGPFQLHYGGMTPTMNNPGVGDEFTKATGLHARDPSTWRQQVDFALDTAKRDGWRQWMGAANTGIPRWAGIKTGQQPGEASVADYRAGTAGDKPVYVADHPVVPVQDGAAGGTAVAAAAPAIAPKGVGGWLNTPIDTGEANKEEPRDILANAIAGLGGTGAKPAARPQYVQPKAARIDDPQIATIDPQQALMQKQQLAEVMAKLNSGKLWA